MDVPCVYTSCTSLLISAYIVCLFRRRRRRMSQLLAVKMWSLNQGNKTSYIPVCWQGHLCFSVFSRPWSQPNRQIPHLEWCFEPWSYILSYSVLYVLLKKGYELNSGTSVYTLPYNLSSPLTSFNDHSSLHVLLLLLLLDGINLWKVKQKQENIWKESFLRKDLIFISGERSSRVVPMFIDHLYVALLNAYRTYGEPI